MKKLEQVVKKWVDIIKEQMFTKDSCNYSDKWI